MKDKFYTIIKDDKKDPGSLIIKLFLWILSVFYYVLVKIRAALFSVGILKGKVVGKPVISVGNITTGGAGKTPFTAYLARRIREQNKKPVILLRGYMDKRDTPSDEALWYRHYLPDIDVLVGEDRYFEAKRFLNENHGDIFIMDDGFQHLNLARDLNIVLIDATSPWGGGHLLPRGFLREPLSALRRADIFVLTKVNIYPQNVSSIEEKLHKIQPEALVVHACHQPELLFDPIKSEEIALETLSEKKVFLFSSIGSPETFKHSVSQLNASEIELRSFMDHYRYNVGDLKSIADLAEKQQYNYIVTTEKDLVKIRDYFTHFSGTKLLVLRIKLQIVKGKDALFERIDHILQR